MHMQPFELERYFAKYEFSAPYLLSCSDCEPLSLAELLAMADSDSRTLWNDLGLGYTESPGHPLLREEIAKLYQTITPRDALVLVPEEGIFVAINSLLEPGDHVITTFPGYQSLYEIARAMGCEVSHWVPRTKDGWTFAVEDLKSLLQENTRLIVINFPHNPTGSTLQEKDLEKIVDIAKRRGIPVLSDEMYRFLEHDEADRVSPICDLYDRGISLFGMSKTFALAGLRIGWLATRDTNALQKFAAYKDYTTICSSAPSEILSIIALRSKAKIINRSLDIIKGNLRVLDDFFHAHASVFAWRRPKAGPIAFVTLKARQNVADFCVDLVNKKGVMLLPSDVYGYAANCFRIGFARKNMPQALQMLENYVQEDFLPAHAHHR